MQAEFHVHMFACTYTHIHIHICNYGLLRTSVTYIPEDNDNLSGLMKTSKAEFSFNASLYLSYTYQCENCSFTSYGVCISVCRIIILPLTNRKLLMRLRFHKIHYSPLSNFNVEENFKNEIKLFSRLLRL